MLTHRDMIKLWPSVADFACDIGVDPNTAKQMRTRDSINGRYWAAMIDGAERRGLAGVSVQSLAQAAAREAAQ